jgi:hypothetical protein
MKLTVFYSWQSYTEPSRNYHFIKEALIKAVEEIGWDLNLIDAQRKSNWTSGWQYLPALKSGLKNSHIFIGDITIWGINGRTGSETYSPDVEMELSFAEAILGKKKCILIENSIFNEKGWSPAKRPDDPYPISYSLPLGANARERNNALKSLVNQLKQALNSAQVSRRQKSTDNPLISWWINF